MRMPRVPFTVRGMLVALVGLAIPLSAVAHCLFTLRGTGPPEAQSRAVSPPAVTAKTNPQQEIEIARVDARANGTFVTAVGTTLLVSPARSSA
jgi:hypothetical protein